MTPHARRGIAAVVEPIPPVLLKRLDGPSTSRLGTGQTGYASAELYAALRKGRADGEDVGVAFKWPSERRLPGKGKERETLVIWVAPLDHDLAIQGCVLYIPQHLLPRFSTPPLTVMVHLHHPIPLTTVILQRTEEADQPSLSDLLESLVGPCSKGLANGYHDSRSRIIREGEIIESDDAKCRVLMLEPVGQGVCTTDTRLVLSSTLYMAPDVGGGDDFSSRLSLAEFDLDAFWSSSVTLQPPDIPDGEAPASAPNGSSTSGSLTPRPGAYSPVVKTDDPEPDAVDSGTRFAAVRATGPGRGGDDVCWVGIGGLGRAGIFEGDWVALHAGSDSRLVKVLAWEGLDEGDDLPASPILIPPNLYRILGNPTDVAVSPTPFGARSPTMPTAKTITIARIATTEGLDKRYERSWMKGLRQYFAGTSRLVRRGDVFSVPVWRDKPLSEEDSDNEDDIDARASHLAYFQVTSLSFDPLVPLEEDFRLSISSKARAGELGVWMDVGEGTRMVLTGVERSCAADRRGDLLWHDIPAPPEPATAAAAQLRDLLSAARTAAGLLQLSLLIKGARGSGKVSLVRYIGDELGYNVIQVDCFDIIGDTPQTLQGTLQARLDKAQTTAPSILLLHHIEALAKKSEATAAGRPPPIVKVVEDALQSLREASKETGWPCVLIGTTVDPDVVPGDLLGVFKQDIVISAPNEIERCRILDNLLADTALAPDVTSSAISSQTAALHAGDLEALVINAKKLALRRASRSAPDVHLAGLSVTAADVASALTDARSAYSDSIGAPKIPNVSWDDIGGLAAVKDEILETIQLPLDHPELFASGLKKRSGILLYGPPGTGKTLLAKAVATSCSLNFFSVKGPELLNMYIGESEANVRRVFQRARDAAPCVVFMDELDSIAPKRGNQGDSGGVMDRIVSQLLAELDGMSKGNSGDVYVMGATNRPDLLDSALLRPGRFDRMVYLSPPQARHEQLSILRALTRRFNLDPALELSDVVERCGYNLTGADFYALASDAMLGAMTRAAERIDNRVRELQDEGDWPQPLTPQYYLDRLAGKEETQVVVGLEEFLTALQRLRPSVSEAEMRHYQRVQGEFRGMTIGK